jgi:hypothetical protein
MDPQEMSCGGQWTVDCGQWTVDCGQWTVDSGQWTDPAQDSDRWRDVVKAPINIRIPYNASNLMTT